MGAHMKTTIELPDALLEQARRFASDHDMTMKALIEQALREAMAKEKERKPFRLRDGSFDGGKGMSPDLKSWEQIRDIIYDPGTGRG